MRMKLCGVLIGVVLTPGSLLAADPPASAPIAIGLDAYRAWDQWPRQKIGMRAYMRSTYDRRGGNEGADASHFLYQLSDDFNVTLDVEGPGVLVFSRYNHWHGSPWHYVVDGTDHIVQESSTQDPLHPAPDSTFLPSAAFPSPLNVTWATTRGADLVWSPVAFARSFQMAYSRTRYGTGYYIYDQFVPGTPLSHPIQSWSPSVVPDKDVLDLIDRSGMDIAPAGKEASGTVDVPSTGKATAIDLKGKGTIRVLSFSIPQEQAKAFEKAHLRITWDGRADPSIDAPTALFFGAGTLYNRDKKEYLVKAFPVNIHFADGRIILTCYFPMPYFRSAHIELAGGGQAIPGVAWQVRTTPLQEPARELTYFHATYRDFPVPTPGEDMVLLDTREAEGAKEWSGNFVGTSFIFSHSANLRTLEGDPRFFFDDSLTPQAQGTGTEEWGGGGDYWGRGLSMTLPFAGHPVGAPLPCANSLVAGPDCEESTGQGVRDEDDKIESAYRYLLADQMPFGKNAVIHLEHGGANESTEHYEAVAYWYGAPAATLVETDRLQIGDAAQEKAHGYSSPEASAPYSLSSRYEWGVDTVGDKTVYPETQDTGRTTKGSSEFRLHLRPDNLGVLLRRKLDYSFADQRAEVYVAGQDKKDWKLAGVWYLAGSNTVIYSNPKGELGATEHNVETSNRRFRDDEFLVSRDLTRGKKMVWIRVKFTPVNRPLYPGYPVGERAWSEMRYTAYCFVAPKAR
jgi:D-arabinan exo alpha-(1,3)/(1,5)-arabinofuranosidase (non-reducing end)